MNYLGQLSHPNLVKLVGYCTEDDNLLLVYEFMPKGSLENHLFISKYCRLYVSLIDVCIDFMKCLSFFGAENELM